MSLLKNCHLHFKILCMSTFSMNFWPSSVQDSSNFRPFCLTIWIWRYVLNLAEADSVNLLTQPELNSIVHLLFNMFRFPVQHCILSVTVIVSIEFFALTMPSQFLFYQIRISHLNWMLSNVIALYNYIYLGSVRKVKPFNKTWVPWSRVNCVFEIWTMNAHKGHGNVDNYTNS